MAPRIRSTVAARAVVGLVVGVVVGAVVTPFLGLAAGLLAGWAVLALIEVVWVLRMVWPMDAAQTRAHATTEDPGRRTARLVAVAGSLASLAAVGVVIVQTRNAPAAVSFVLAGVALLSVASSWALIQTDYILRFAHVYYEEPVGGIDFNQEAEPMYTDFAYVSFGLGVAYQVSDTNLTSNAMRRIVIAQTLISYVFGAIILAAVVNLVAGL
ncbi:MAG: DUF1345 domain-containing protein [Microbacterium sp.]|uniref:DUF1345 domain-containing protein n=3 Tax=Microbacterium sp. TaxID=51671 RepID=UPI001AD157BA|nr:DUF1345 domain-containing protein [Microbacterium sp.]MBN9153149.1 DUF1345 domain-containing protein [Microbacterium sp.]MBN9171788.1 DUF1345 domain-containing protein [Microbacterium sp.]MBN9189292.1 DUF1345 domain-containing protein [Microbacterium sp.]MBN9196957.1 DUF1345 domain-containing protein [Microbacterium sp.]